MDLKDRILSFIDRKGLSVRDFERACGLSNGAVSKMGNDTRRSTLDKISTSFPDVNPEWLLAGVGSMLLSDNPKTTAIPIDAPEVVYLPVVPHSARAGTLGEYEQLFADDYSRRQPIIVTRQMHGRYICFQIEGDSMEPTLRHGDVVMARHIDRDLYKDSKLHLRSWSIWIIVTRTDGILIKEIADHDVKGGVLTLHSLNPLYEDLTVHLSDVIDIYNVIEIVSRHL